MKLKYHIRGDTYRMKEWQENLMGNNRNKDIQRTELLVQVARLYYEHDLSQNEIAKKINLSRPYISKLLHEAKQAGIVKIKIEDPVMSENWLERKLRVYYGLNKVIVVPKVEDINPLQQVGEAGEISEQHFEKWRCHRLFLGGDHIRVCQSAAETG